MLRKRNRKRKKIKVFVIPVPFTSLVVLVGALALAYVCLDSRCEAIGREILALESESSSLDMQCMNARMQWTQLKSPRNLEEALARNGIEMTWPRGDQVVRLSDPGLLAKNYGNPFGDDDREVAGRGLFADE